MHFRILFILFLLSFLIRVDAASVPSTPHLEKRGEAIQLMVQDQPFLALACEVHNSSSSSREYMSGIWPRLASMHLNTVLTPVSWEQIEPKEGQFDFTLLDGLIDDARQNQLHLVLLWFGTWKNMVSSYAPAWARSDPSRFPLAVDASGNRLPIPSTFSATWQQADAQAFAALMKHLRAVDGDKQTVLMVQVENEVGIPNDRDHSALANQAYAGPVPAELMDYLMQHRDELTTELKAVWSAAGSKTSGTWEDVFGSGPATAELFMAWNYARYINGVVEAGKAEYPIPLYVNVAIGRKDGALGSYPVGGALPVALNIWQAGAPRVDMFSPDMYYGDFENWCKAYTQSRNPFFIPETRGGIAGAATALLAIGAYRAIGISPFGIDGDNTSSSDLAEAYGCLEQLSPMILAHQADGSISAAVLNQDNPSQTLELGGYALNVTLRHERKAPQVEDLGKIVPVTEPTKATTVAAQGYVLVIAEQPDRFIVAGKDVQITFAVDGPAPAVVELAKVEEGAFTKDGWVPGRRLNGDEIMLSYDFSALAAKNQTGTGLNLGPDHLTLLRVDVFRRN
jgi:hypothetical protein